MEFSPALILIFMMELFAWPWAWLNSLLIFFHFSTLCVVPCFSN